LAATEAAAVDAAARVDDTARALQLLAGDPAGSPMPLAGGAGSPDSAQLPTLQGAAPLVWPVDLLRLRPDLQAAEQAWRAAVADSGARQAARRPSLRLPGVLTLGSTSGGALLGQVTASLAAALAVPLLDGGQRDADRDAALAREQAAAISLRQAVQQALGDVESALRAAESGRARLAAQARAVQEAEASVGQARTLYTAGLAGFLDVLDAQRSALDRRQTLLRMQGDAARASVATFEALGLIDDPA
jgi:multidrug efflux system outer membrane protein